MKNVYPVLFGDFVSFWLSLLLIITIRLGFLDKFALEKHLVPFLILYLAWVFIFYLFGLYDLFNIKPTIPHFRHFGLALLLCFLVGIILFYFLPIFGIAPKTNLVFQVFGFGLFSFILRRLFYITVSKRLIKNTILIGERSNLDEIASAINKNPQLGLKICDYQNNLSKNFLTLQNSVFIMDTNSSEIPIEQIAVLYEKQNEVLDIALAYEKYLSKIPVDYISGSWVLENIKIKKDIFYRLFSRIFDITFSLSILIISSPFLILTMLARLIEDGNPIFLKQKRVGLNGKIFNLYKIRSMIVLSRDGSAETRDAIWSTGKTDNRITPVGKIIRKLHIDEIPQMINILKGDLTLVGPRPERPEFVSELEKSIPYYKLRHIIRPGFTGWAQIKYHYANTVESSKEKFEYDLYYIKNRNIFIDFGIILRTIQIIFTH